MWKKVWTITAACVCLAGVLGLTTACTKTDVARVLQENTADNDNIPGKISLEKQVPFKTEIKGVSSGIKDARKRLILTEADWRGLWKEHMSIRRPVPALPEVDFAQYALIAVFVGERNSGGYQVEIIKIKESDGQYHVYYQETAPSKGKGRMVTMALTQPYHIIKVRKPIGNVQFSACGEE